MPSNIKYFITVSDFSKNILQPLLPASSRFYSVTNPINTEISHPSDPSKELFFTFVGRITPEKGADLFAQASALSNVPAQFVGDGSYVNFVKNLNPGAEYLGWQDFSGVTCSLKRSRALVFPSRWYETQGLVVKEAAALGIPAIVSDSCAASESIVDGETGLLFRSGDVVDLVSKIKLLNNNPQFARNLGLAAYNKYWEEPENLQRHIDELLACYNSINSSENLWKI